MSGNRLQKIAIVGGDVGSGSNEKVRWDTFQWDVQRATVNLHDYDFWIFNVSSIPKEIPPNSLFTTLSVAYVLEALSRDTRIIVFGDPRVTFKLQSANRRFLDWTGHSFYWKDVGGDTLEINSFTVTTFPEIVPYLSQLRRWTYSLRSIYPTEEFKQTAGLSRRSGGEGYSFNLFHLVQNRHQEGICSGLELRKDSAFESIFLVPENPDTNIPSFHVFLFGLGIEVKEKAPPWLESIFVPGQKPLDAEITDLSEKIATAVQQLEDAQKARESLRECLEVLYQSGTRLERAVTAMLDSLGGTVTELPVTNECDRFLCVKFNGQTHKAVLEIKGIKNEQFNIKGLRQVKEWRDNHLLATDEEAKAIFIGNSDITREPSTRPSPFPDQWVKNAEKFGVACITTPVLYEAFSLHKAGRLNVEKFWEILFTTDGVVDASGPSMAVREL